ncbi:flavin reductase family protein [Marinomonas ostreistagni]|uniref:flavin reductase family protein n=1 Tax=Marinomonas ostreistagni TaxID=359209 RepID=UPI001951F007|nr:flavin reductase family protein [Marinomonas ostreistagni]MBM6550157.1 flavin reductase family protein [Marinomonas ostreistagni]
MNVATQELGTRELYQLLVNGVTPRPIAWISTVSDDGIDNLAPYSFFNVVSVNPPVLSYTQVNPQSGVDKDTLQNLEANGECVVHIVSEHTLEKMNQSCASLPLDQSEFEFADIASEPSLSVAPRSVSDAWVRYECTLRDVVRISAEPGGGTMVLLDVKQVVINDELLNDGKIDQHKLNAVGKMGGDFYSFTHELTALSRPTI